MKANDAFVLREVGSVRLLVPVRRNAITERYLALNEMAAWVWQNAAGYRTAKSLAVAAGKHFGLSCDATDKVEDFCRSMVSTGLMEM